MFELGTLESFSYLYLFISITGIVLSRFNMIIILLALDIILFSISLMFIYTSIITYEPSGQIFAFLLLPVAAAETAVGLGLVSVIYKVYKKTSFDGRL